MIKSKNFKRIIIGMFAVSLVFIPVCLFAEGIVPCNGPTDCNWNTLMTLINRIINFVLFVLAVPIAAIMFAYAGILLLSSGGNTTQMGKAKKIFSSVAIGLIIAAAAWLIIHTVLSILGYSGSWIGF
jgi:hypothetical protein